MTAAFVGLILALFVVAALVCAVAVICDAADEASPHHPDPARDREARALRCALHVFGDEDNALDWLEAPNEAFDFLCPRDVARASVRGLEQVQERLRAGDP